MEITSLVDLLNYLRLSLGHRDREVFVLVSLDASNRLIAIDELFQGTATTLPVLPREVVRAALRRNSVSVVIAHCHPATPTKPSREDTKTTRRLVKLLKLVDVFVIDHIVVSGSECFSFAGAGLLPKLKEQS